MWCGGCVAVSVLCGVEGVLLLVCCVVWRVCCVLCGVEGVLLLVCCVVWRVCCVLLVWRVCCC